MLDMWNVLNMKHIEDRDCRNELREVSNWILRNLKSCCVYESCRKSKTKKVLQREDHRIFFKQILTFFTKVFVSP